MRKLLLGIISAVLIIGLFAGIGYAGYRIGYNQGAQAAGGGESPRFRQFENFGLRGLPMPNFGRGIERGFNRGFGPDGFRRMGFGFSSPILFLGRIALLGLVLWFSYWLFTRSGWRLTRTPQATATTPPSTEGGNQNAEADQ